jgi:hypothetical protein
VRVFCAALAFVVGLVGAAAGEHPLVAAARQRQYVPAPPVVHTVYGPVNASLNQDGAAVGAYADPAAQTIYLPKDPSPFMRAHETAHLFDAQVLTDGDRSYFQRLMHAPQGAWNHGETYGRVEGEASPNEWFADYYGALASGLTPDKGYSVGQFAEIGAKRLQQFAAALERVGHRQHLRAYRPGP